MTSALDPPRFVPDLEQAIKPGRPPIDPAEDLLRTLTAPVWYETADLPRAEARARATLGEGGAGATSFAELFCDPRPGVEVLTAAKDYAKESRGDPDGPLRPEVATVLYYTAIAAARVRHGAVITAHGPADLRAGWEWVAALPWVTPDIRGLVTDALARPGP